MSNNKMATKADLQELYNRILPYLGGMPEFVGNKIDRSDIYSTSEKIVGCWTNGKPVYQKCVNFGALPNATTKTVAHGITNLDYVIHMFGVAKKSDSTAWQNIPQTGYASTNVTDGISLAIKSSNVEIRTGNDRSSFTTCYIILQYTKTTDAANSYNCANENDYSTSEKIIGTWIDGKPIYQKTFTGTLTNTSSVSTETATTMSMGVNVDKYIDIFGEAISSSGAHQTLPAVRMLSSQLSYIRITGHNSSSSPANTISIGNSWYTSGTNTYIVTVRYIKTS